MNQISVFSSGGDSSSEPRWVKWLLLGITFGFLGLCVILPLVVVFAEALGKGWSVYFSSLSSPAALSAIKLTLRVAAWSVGLNLIFGLAAAWAIAKFDFRGRGLLICLIDLPFAVSPVISGLIFVLLLGIRGWLGSYFADYGLSIIFAEPGLILVTVFVTFPFIARELIALMKEQGTEEELAALSLGASGWRIFRRITLPNAKWALLYGIMLCNARAMGEFGAVSVVSGHIQGKTNTMPLHIELLYNEYNYAAAFSVASLLTLLALVTLLAKLLLEHMAGGKAKHGH